MKRERIVGWCAAAFCLIFLTGAARAAGLEEFTGQRRYDGTVFSDVSGGDWFVAGVKAVYEKGIMSGVGDGLFSPGSSVSVAEAVTIAARMHATYHRAEIPARDGAWYEAYAAYAAENGLLPAGRQTDWTAPADRGYIACVFSKVLDAGDLPAVNLGAHIPDADSIPDEYRAAAELLYRGGVLTGKTGGQFDAGALATRAEIAIVAMRLVEPPERVSGDPLLDAGYVAQQMNYMNGTPVCATGDGFAVLTRNMADKPVIRLIEGENAAELLCTRDYDELTWFDGMLYAFSREYLGSGYDQTVSASAYRIDVAAGTQTRFVTFASEAENGSCYFQQMLSYDGVLWFLIREELEWPDERRWKTNTCLYALGADGAPERKCVVDGNCAQAISAFDRQVVFGGRDGLHVYDTRTGATRWLMGQVSAFVLSGNTLLYGDKSGNLAKVALTAPHLPKTLANIDGKTYEYIDGINSFGGAIYVTDHKGWLCRYTPDGTFVRLRYMESLGYRFGIFGSEFYVGESRGGGSDSFSRGWVGNLAEPYAMGSFFEWCYGGAVPGGKPAADPSAPPQPSERLSAEQIYAACAPAVFYVEVEDGGAGKTGSGFFVDGNGIAVTNHHVIAGAVRITVLLTDGRRLTARVIASDAALDIAILSISIRNAPSLPLGDSDAVLGGQTVYAIGSPLGMTNSITGGMISNPRRMRGLGDHFFIQISVPISPGSSGGALIDEFGRVIGITSGTFGDGQNLNLAVPIHEILPLLP